MLGHLALFVTDFADGGVMIPLCIAVGVTLAACRRFRAAIAWSCGILGVWGTMLLLKLAGYTVDHVAPTSSLAEWGIVTPSGHVASAAAAYGGMVGLLLGRRPLSIRWACLVGAAVALLVGVTRVVLGDHTVGEVVVGAAVGVAGAAAVASLTRGGLGGPSRTVVLGVAAAVLLLCHGSHLSWERQIRQASVQAVSDWSVFVRAGW